MNQYTWEQSFRDLFHRCLEKYRAGDSDFEKYYDDEDLALLGAVGYKPREIFDFIEDHEDHGEPSIETAILVAAVRRDYLDTMQGGKPSENQIKPDDLPGRDKELEGYRWLPRIIVKATGKLKGELHPDIMFSCGGDRGFLKEHDIHPADFLRVVWSADGGADEGKILEYEKWKSKA